MTTYATRSPLQLLSNPHMMSEPRRSSRRLSARQPEKEDLHVANGVGHGTERGKGGQINGMGGKQGKASVNGTSTNAKGGRGKRKIVYDEESDGFTFKRAKAEPKVPPIEEERPELELRTAPVKKTRKKSPAPTSNVPAVEEAVEKPRRRSARHSGEHSAPSPPPLNPKKRRVKEKEPDHEARKREEKSTAAHDREELQQRTERVEGSPRVGRSHEVTTVSLPFADTPVIRRNQEMRKGSGDGQRRSSLGMRGRRASSLIDSGKSNALPHDEVASSEFYKHIEANGLSEPRRMRQLLTWCGTRALGDKPLFSSEDSHARLAAREIQQQLLKDFSTKSELSDWYPRDSTPPRQPPVPNPKNMSNIAKIQDLEQQIARLQTERQTWESLLRPPTSEPLLPPLPTNNPNATSIDPTLLSSESQIAALAALQSFTTTDIPATSSKATADDSNPTTTASSTSLQSTTTARLSKVTSALEFEIDKFAGNVHALSAYKDAAERVADEVLGMSAKALEEREREGVRRANGGEEGVGMRGVLKGLSRVIES